MIRFKVPYRQFRPGDLCETFTPGVEATMVQYGRAEYVMNDPVHEETRGAVHETKALMAPVMDRAIHSGDVPIKRKRGRPPKNRMQ